MTPKTELNRLRIELDPDELLSILADKAPFRFKFQYDSPLNLFLNDEEIGYIDGFNAILLIFDKFSIYSGNEYCRRLINDELSSHFFQDITKQIIRDEKLKEIL